MKPFFKFIVALVLFSFGLLLGAIIVVGVAEFCRDQYTSRHCGFIGVGQRAASLGVATPRNPFGHLATAPLRPVPFIFGRASFQRAKSDPGVTGAPSCRPEYCVGAISG